MRTSIFQLALLLSLLLLVASCTNNKSDSNGNNSTQNQEETQYQNEIDQERDAENAARIEKEQAEQEEINKYLNNRLSTGAMPYSKYYGSNNACGYDACSQIHVITPNNSDVLVTIKRNGTVRHAYISASSSYTFNIPDGTYQAFFYYGKGWNPNKVMKKTANGEILGGFVTNESFGEDDPQFLSGNILTYELILQANGNFSTQPSSAADAL